MSTDMRDVAVVEQVQCTGGAATVRSLNGQGIAAWLGLTANTPAFARLRAVSSTAPDFGSDVCRQTGTGHTGTDLHAGTVQDLDLIGTQRASGYVLSVKSVPGRPAWSPPV